MLKSLDESPNQDIAKTSKTLGWSLKHPPCCKNSDRKLERDTSLDKSENIRGGSDHCGTTKSENWVRYGSGQSNLSLDATHCQVSIVGGR